MIQTPSRGGAIPRREGADMDRAEAYKAELDLQYNITELEAEQEGADDV